VFFEKSNFSAGVVIGFVISYRAMSGCVLGNDITCLSHVSLRYDRYWAGRTAWSDTTRNARTLARLIWIHVPLRLHSEAPPKRQGQLEEGEESSLMSEARRVLREKEVALDLIEAYVADSGTK
jgi:ion channel-forming bestrophin family protein